MNMDDIFSQFGDIFGGAFGGFGGGGGQRRAKGTDMRIRVKLTLEEIAHKYEHEETENRSYPTYMDVYNAFYDDVLHQIETLPTTLPLNNKAALLEVYYKQTVVDLLKLEDRYYNSKMEW